MEYLEYLDNFFKKLEFPKEASDYLIEFENKIRENKKLDDKLNKYLNDYMYCEDKDLRDYLTKIDVLADYIGLDTYTLQFMFILRCMPIVQQRYNEAGYDEQLFWDGAADLKYKMLECKECKGVYGTFVGGWNDDFIKLNRFALGRFQYVLRHSRHDTLTTQSGLVLHTGDPYLEFHIPSSGVPLTDDVRNDSYRRAWEFFKDQFGDKPVYLSTSSWLIYPEHKMFLSEKSNIRKFIDDFDICFAEPKDNFNDSWRLYGRYADLPPEEWPEDTSMRRDFKKWILSGGKTGNGWGLILMENGENVTHKKWRKL
ncbi:MAG: acyltransferase domain-containing protein [Clostridia bacterium]|nr:acyltransferase domain-containing protein [Clostridia bacterium]